MLFTSLLITLATLGVNAQSTFSQAVSKITYPPSRGSDPLVSGIGPCQGYEVGGRIEYPLTGGRVGWQNIRDLGDVQLAYSRNLDPQSQSDFTPVGQNISRSWVGTQCVNGPNFSELGLSAGDQVVLQLSWTAGPRRAAGHECMDLTLLSPSDYAALNMSIVCENHVLSTQMRSSANPRLTELRAQAAAAEASANSTSTSTSNLTVTQAGIVGAMTTLGVCIIAILAAQVAGIAAFGKKAKYAKRNQERAQVQKEVDSLNSA